MREISAGKVRRWVWFLPGDLVEHLHPELPSAIRAAKRLMNQASRSVDDTAAALLMAESKEQSKLIGSAEQAEAVKANLEKRSPVF